MEKNYTPLELEEFQDNKTTTFLLVLAIITLAILAVVLFLFIQKKLKENNLRDNKLQQKEEITISPSPTTVNEEVFPSSTIEATEELSPLPSSTTPMTIIKEAQEASLSPTAIISPEIINKNESP